MPCQEIFQAPPSWSPRSRSFEVSRFLQFPHPHIYCWRKENDDSLPKTIFSTVQHIVVLTALLFHSSVNRSIETRRNDSRITPRHAVQHKCNGYSTSSSAKVRPDWVKASKCQRETSLSPILKPRQSRSVAIMKYHKHSELCDHSKSRFKRFPFSVALEKTFFNQIFPSYLTVM